MRNIVAALLICAPIPAAAYEQPCGINLDHFEATAGFVLAAADIHSRISGETRLAMPPNPTAISAIVDDMETICRQHPDADAYDVAMMAINMDAVKHPEWFR